MTDAGSSAEARGKTLAERIGKENVRRIAAVGIAVASLLGISGEPETGVGVNAEMPNPFTGLQEVGGILVSSNTGEHPLGFPQEALRNLRNIEAFRVRLGNASVIVYRAEVLRPDGKVLKTVGVFPSAETKLGK